MIGDGNTDDDNCTITIDFRTQRGVFGAVKQENNYLVSTQSPSISSNLRCCMSRLDDVEPIPSESHANCISLRSHAPIRRRSLNS